MCFGGVGGHLLASPSEPLFSICCCVPPLFARMFFYKTQGTTPEVGSALNSIPSRAARLPMGGSDDNRIGSAAEGLPLGCYAAIATTAADADDPWR